MEKEAAWFSCDVREERAGRVANPAGGCAVCVESSGKARFPARRLRLPPLASALLRRTRSSPASAGSWPTDRFARPNQRSLGRRCRAVGDCVWATHSATRKAAGNVAPVFEGADVPPSPTAVNRMARADQEIQAAAPTAIEVLWLRRPRPRQLPGQFLPAAVAPEPQPTLLHGTNHSPLHCTAVQLKTAR